MNVPTCPNMMTSQFVEHDDVKAYPIWWRHIHEMDKGCHMA